MFSSFVLGDVTPSTPAISASFPESYLEVIYRGLTPASFGGVLGKEIPCGVSNFNTTAGTINWGESSVPKIEPSWRVGPRCIVG